MRAPDGARPPRRDQPTRGARHRPHRRGVRPGRREFSLGYWVWSFLAAPAPIPEKLIAAAPGVMVDHMLDAWSEVPGVFPDTVRAAYTAAFSDPATVHAVCEEYRAAATLDVADDEPDRGRRRINCATLVLWSATGPVGQWYDALEIWKQWATDVRGGAMPATSCPKKHPRKRYGTYYRY